MAFRQHPLQDAAKQYADQRESKCKEGNCNRSHAIHPINAKSRLIACFLLHEFLHGLVDREAAWLLPRWKLLEGCEMLSNDRLRRHKHKHVLNEPFVITAGLVFGTLEGIGTQVENLGRTQRD